MRINKILPKKFRFEKFSVFFCEFFMKFLSYGYINSRLNSSVGELNGIGCWNLASAHTCQNYKLSSVSPTPKNSELNLFSS